MAGPYELSLKAPVGDEPYALPLPLPDAASGPPQTRPALSESQQEKLSNLIAHFNAPSFELPTTVKALKLRWKLAAGGSTRSLWGYGSEDKTEVDSKALDDRERCYWSKEQFARTLRAVKWNYDAAVKRAEETCVWRREFGVEDLGADRIEEEALTGKEVIFGFDIAQRPVLYMHPYRQNTAQSMRQIEFVVWCLERVLDLCPPTEPATEMLCLCIDFGANRPDNKAQPTSVTQAKRVLDILQGYYYERLGRAICVNVPSFFWAFYKLVGPFVDPSTKEKIRFNPDVRTLVPPAQLEKSCFLGDLNFVYNHEEYFPALTKLCAERKAAVFERWQKYGEGKCGVSEVILRGAVDPAAEGAKERVSPNGTLVPSAEDSADKGLETDPEVEGAGERLSKVLSDASFKDAPEAPVEMVKAAS